ncbi:MAG: hypothetical protein ABI574_19340 [Burkholderiales bacterium]
MNRRLFNTLSSGHHDTRSARQRALRIGAYLLAAVVCALVFMSYLQPGLMVDLGNRISACF